MKNILKIVSLYLRRNKLMLVIALVGAVLMCFIYESGKKVADDYSDETIVVGFIDHDDSFLSDDLQTYLTKSLNMKLKTDDYNSLSSLLLNHDISVIIEVPKDFYQSALENNPNELVITSLDDYANIAYTKAYLDSYMQSVSVAAQAAQSDEDFAKILSSTTPQQLAIDTSSKVANVDNYDGLSFAMSFLGMLLAGVCIFVSLNILDDKIDGTYNRMRISNVKPIQYIIGCAVVGIIGGIILAGGLLAYIAAIGENQNLPMGIALLATGLFILFSVGFAIMLALLTESKTATTTVTIGFTTVASMVGGMFFPLDDSVGWIVNLSYFTPHYWFGQIMNYYDDITPASNLAILTLFVVLVYLVSAVVYAKKRD